MGTGSRERRWGRRTGGRYRSRREAEPDESGDTDVGERPTAVGRRRASGREGQREAKEEGATERTDGE